MSVFFFAFHLLLCFVLQVKDASPHSSSASSTHVDDNQSVSVEEAADQSALSSTTPATVAHSSTTSTSIASASIDPGSEAPEANNDLSKTSTTPRQPFSMTSTQYEAMTHALAYRLSSLEKEKENDGEPWQGCPKNDLVQWYLKEVSLFLVGSLNITIFYFTLL